MQKVAALFASILLMSCMLAAQLYQATLLESLVNGKNVPRLANGINDSGRVVGICKTLDGSFHACYWSANGAVTDLGTLGGRWANGLAINNLNQVVGQSTIISGDSKQLAFLWTQASGMQSLPSLGGGWNDGAFAINDSTDVVGYSYDYDNNDHAVLWTPSGSIQDLGTLPGGTQTSPLGINAAGHIVGAVQFADFTQHAFLWTEATGMLELAPASGLKNYGAIAINNSDQVTGWFTDPADQQAHAFSWTQATGIQDLGTLESGWSEAFAINDSGDIVGYGGGRYDTFALIWRPSEAIQKLGPLTGKMLVGKATGINSSGQIAANGHQPYLLTPTWVKLTHKLSFGSWPVGQTSTVKTATLTNIGSTTLTINSITITGADSGDFAQVNTCGSSLAPGTKCAIRVAFTPTAPGTRTAAINISDSDRTSPQKVNLTGSGI